MPKYSNYVRTRIELLHNQGLHPAGILKTLKGEGLVVSLSGITRMIKKLHLTGSVANLPRSGRPRKLSVEARAFIDQQMRKNDEMTSAKIQKKLAKRGICVSSSTVRRSRKQQGWTLQRTAYCQLIRDANKVKRLEFAQRVLESGDTFHNVIFSDECSISLQSYRRTCFRMADEPTKRKPKPKHPLIVSERFFLFNVLSWLHFNPFSAPYFKGGILLKRFGFLQILTCSISFLWRDQATSGAQEKLRTERGPCKNLSLSRHSTVNDVIKSAKCVGLGPRTTNTFYMSV